MRRHIINRSGIRWIITFLFFWFLFFILHEYLSAPKIVMSYFSPQEDTAFVPSMYRIDDQVKRLNVLAYAFLQVNPDGKIMFNDKAHHAGVPESFRYFQSIPNTNHRLKKILYIGGADDKQSFFNAIQHIDHFVNSAGAIIDTYHLAGIDLDFEINRPYTPEEAIGYARLVERLRKKLGTSVLISMATIIDPETLQSVGRDHWHVIANHANFISMMCYDLTSPFSQPAFTELASNLYSVPEARPSLQNQHLSCDQSIRYLNTLGVPMNKMVLGIPAYAISYGGVGFEGNGLFQPSVPDKTPVFDDMMKGQLRYSTVVRLHQKGFKEHRLMTNGQVNGVWVYNPDTYQWVTFDNPQSVQSKTAYVVKNKLAGVMLWRIGQDVSSDHKDSLLKAIVDGLHQ